MCRLYGMRASHPTRAACELLDSQNALIEQAVEDGRGLENPHGWGVARVNGGVTDCARQVEPADGSEAFRNEALGEPAEIVVAHVRRATVGDPAYENTHPFRDGSAIFAHNGHVGRFDEVRPQLIEELSESGRERILGTTDSEHVFQLARSYARDGASTTEALQQTARKLRGWAESLDDGGLALNVLWGDHGSLAGTKIGRTLWYLEREQPVHCDLCGREHADPPENEEYRSIVVASEPITDEDWNPVPETSVFEIDDGPSVEFEPLFG